MKINLIYPSYSPEYSSDILVRIYPNQQTKFTATDFEPGWYCGDVYCRNGASSKFEGVITADHPQGIKDMLEKLYVEQKNNDVLIEIENGMENGRPHPDCNDKDWFDICIKRIIRGDLDYN